jgi:hypothetical protein
LRRTASRDYQDHSRCDGWPLAASVINHIKTDHRAGILCLPFYGHQSGFFDVFDIVLGWFGAAWLRRDHGSNRWPCANFIK